MVYNVTFDVETNALDSKYLDNDNCNNCI